MGVTYSVYSYSYFIRVRLENAELHFVGMRIRPAARAPGALVWRRGA